MDKRPEQFEGKAESGDKSAEKAPLAVPMKEERIQLAQVDTSAAAIPTVVADSKQTIPPSEVAASETAPIDTPRVKVSRTATAPITQANGVIFRAVAVLMFIYLLSFPI